MASPRIVIVHDYLTQRRGAERVVLTMLKAFPNARVLTSVYHPAGTFPEFSEYKIEVSWLNRVAQFRKDPRVALPFLACTFGRWHVDADVVLASSSGWAHGIQTNGAKVVYCYNPARWLYQETEYVAPQRIPIRLALAAITPALRKWDQKAATSASTYLTSSSVVRDRIHAAYGIKADILPPPISLDVSSEKKEVHGVDSGYFLIVGGRRRYKNVDVVCRAFMRLPACRLVVVGPLPDCNGGAWPSNIVGLEDVSDSELRWLYANATAVVAASHEDFGLTPLEANAFGKPAIVLEAGGFLDTLEPGVSGVFLQCLDENHIADVIHSFDPSEFDARTLRIHAQRYDESTFISQLRKVVLDRAGVAAQEGPPDLRRR